MNEQQVKLFESVQVLTGSTIPKRYWSDLRKKLEKESGQPYEKIVRLKLLAKDGKARETDTADVQTLARLIQSIPSPRAEPFKPPPKLQPLVGEMSHMATWGQIVPR